MAQTITLDLRQIIYQGEIEAAESARRNGKERLERRDEELERRKEELERGKEELESRKGELESGKEGPESKSVRYDPMQGLWVHAEKEPDLPESPEVSPHSDPATAPFVMGVDSMREKSTSENGSVLKWSSWYGAQLENHDGLVMPVATEVSEPELEGEAFFQDASIASLQTKIQDVVGPGPQTLATDGNNSLSAPVSRPDWSQGGTMWQAEPIVGEATPNQADPAGEMPQETQDDEASRWFGLKGALGDPPVLEDVAVPPTGDVPVLEVFSLAGGVGKTSLVASLGRVLSARGESVMLVEATSLGSLSYFFGSCESRPGSVRNFRPPASRSEAPIRLATVDPDVHVENIAQGSLATEIREWARGTSRIVVDVATRSTATARALAWMSPTVLVPLVPDVNSVLTVRSIGSFFQQQAATQGASSEVYYILNQFDPSLPLHQEVRKVLQKKLGEHLLPFEMQRVPGVSEALAEGMTIMDYAPESYIAGDFANLANWIESIAAPADLHTHSKRWSER